jgi:hypothetical protein
MLVTLQTNHGSAHFRDRLQKCVFPAGCYPETKDQKIESIQKSWQVWIAESKTELLGVVCAVAPQGYGVWHLTNIYIFDERSQTLKALLRKIIDDANDTPGIHGIQIRDTRSIGLFAQPHTYTAKKIWPVWKKLGFEINKHPTMSPKQCVDGPMNYVTHMPFSKDLKRPWDNRSGRRGKRSKWSAEESEASSSSSSSAASSLGYSSAASDVSSAHSSTDSDTTSDNVSSTDSDTDSDSDTSGTDSDSDSDSVASDSSDSSESD